MSTLPKFAALGGVLAAAAASSLTAQVDIGPAFVDEHFGPDQELATEQGGARNVFAADLDGDLDLDVLSVSQDDGAVAIYQNLGNGAFGPQHVIDVVQAANNVYAAPLDGDLLADVVVSSQRGELCWYRNLGGGSFAPKVVLRQGAQGAGFVNAFQDVRAVDVNENGTIDLLVALHDGALPSPTTEVAWYQNIGQGVFLSPPLPITSDVAGPIRVDVVDLDDDLIPDLLTAAEYDDEVAWYKNLGGGVFGPKQPLSTWMQDGIDIVLGIDLNGGGPDALWSAKNSSTIGWNENLGGGSFGGAQIIATELFAWDLDTGDLDGDGDTDVLASIAPWVGDSKVVWFENHGGGNLGSARTIHANGSSGIHAADLDGDGSADALSAGWENEFHWFESRENSALVEAYSCGWNPEGSISVVSGTPTIGTSLFFGVDNPVGLQSAGSLPFVAISGAPDPSYPCGTVIGGFGMTDLYYPFSPAPGSVLIHAVPFMTLQGAPWTGPGNPAPVKLTIPNKASLVGLETYAQGILLDSAPGAYAPVGLTRAVRLRIGS